MSLTKWEITSPEALIIHPHIPTRRISLNRFVSIIPPNEPANQKHIGNNLCAWQQGQRVQVICILTLQLWNRIPRITTLMKSFICFHQLSVYVWGSKKCIVGYPFGTFGKIMQAVSFYSWFLLALQYVSENSVVDVSILIMKEVAVRSAKNSLWNILYRIKESNRSIYNQFVNLST